MTFLREKFSHKVGGATGRKHAAELRDNFLVSVESVRNEGWHKVSLYPRELSPIFGDGLKDQAAAVWA